ncbi:uncharacterized protein RHO25_012224 [Cercospora beticola]|uniref:Uncharacterized protein n=1 Tax=Cercospora beticola TaxID=122368 RepID=A0ABZ0P6W8_CERBT|nr:hypothetical protein RHO25_012224 [Cercospora beticola]
MPLDKDNRTQADRSSCNEILPIPKGDIILQGGSSLNATQWKDVLYDTGKYQKTENSDAGQDNGV